MLFILICGGCEKGELQNQPASTPTVPGISTPHTTPLPSSKSQDMPSPTATANIEIITPVVVSPFHTFTSKPSAPAHKSPKPSTATKKSTISSTPKNTNTATNTPIAATSTPPAKKAANTPVVSCDGDVCRIITE